VAGWYEKHFNYRPEKRWIIKTPGVVFALAMAVAAYTDPGDCVLIQEPVYYPFRNVILQQGRVPVVNPLRMEGDRYLMDFDDLEKKAADPHVKMLILCSPHNPVGRVWTREELERMGDICVRHGVMVLADEIHNDLIMPGFTYVPFAAIKPEFARHSITSTSPSKTFNLAGMQDSCIIISDPKLRESFQRLVNNLHVGSQNPFSLVATTVGYSQCAGWVDELMEYIAGNYKALADGLAQHLPKARIIPMEGTYLAWADLSAYLTGPDTPEIEMGKKAGIALDGGPWFGHGGDGFLRFNLACPRSTVEQAVAQMADAFAK